MIRDLQPYVCTYKQCPDAKRLYNNRREWFEHEAQHYSRKWFCKACAIPFPDKGIFGEHMETAHPEIVAASDIVVLAWQSELFNDMPCAICGLEFAVDNLAKNLGGHLLQAALFALPHQEEGSPSVGSLSVGSLNFASEGSLGFASE